MPLVSIIIPAFNAAPVIGDAIRSAQAQSEAHVEMVVVDDASTDDTAVVVEGLAARDARVRLLRMERNGGPGVARNAGLDAARGEWIALLDADDRYHPQRLRVLRNRRARNQQPRQHRSPHHPPHHVRCTRSSARAARRLGAVGRRNA